MHKVKDKVFQYTPQINEIFSKVKTLFWRHYKVIIIVLFLAINYILFNTVYANVFLRVGKPTYVGDVQGSDQPVSYYFDKFQETRYNGQDTYQLIGWAFLKELNRPLADYKLQIVLINEQSVGYVFENMGLIRTDVTKYFSSLKLNLDNSGFEVNISKYVLPKGKYNIALLYSLPDSSESILYRTDYYLYRTANNLQLIH